MPLIPVVPENHSHVLAEFDCLDPLLSALRLDSGRLKVPTLSACLQGSANSIIVSDIGTISAKKSDISDFS